MPELDIVMPVFNEGEGIIRVLASLERQVRTTYRVLVCYDFDGDTTLEALRGHEHTEGRVVLVRNKGRGAFAAVVSGFRASSAPAVVVLPADDDYNAGRLDEMYAQFRAGKEIVVASRFIPGGRMVGCPWLKSALVRSSAFFLFHAARLPTRDPSNGLRLFSRRVLERIPLESSVGFTYSIELLVKCHRLRWPIGEVAAEWHERRQGQSRFKVLRWLPGYLRWFLYAFATTYLRRPPRSVRLHPDGA